MRAVCQQLSLRIRPPNLTGQELADGSAAIVYGIVKVSSKASFNNSTTLSYVGVETVLLVIYAIYAIFRKSQSEWCRYFCSDGATLPVQ